MRKLIPTVVDKLQAAREENTSDGWITRSELYRRTSPLPAKLLGAVLVYLKHRGELEEIEEPVQTGFPGGKRATRYRFTYNAELGPLPEDLPPEFLPSPDPPLTTIPTTYLESPQRCTWCSGKLPPQTIGRPRLFCKPECRAASALAASNQMLGIIKRCQNTYTINIVARLIVAADLTSRGFAPFNSMGLPGPLVMLKDGVGKTVGVWIANEAGDYYKGEDGCDIKAVVRRDGCIRYEGIEFEPERSEEAAGDGDEPSPAAGE